MDYRMKVYQVETETGLEWMVDFPDLKYCSGSGESIEEAIEVAQNNKKMYLETLAELGERIPEPSSEQHSYSGKVLLRMSKGLHRQMSERASEESVSLNQLLVEAVAEYVSIPQEKIVNRLSRIVDNFGSVIGNTSVLIQKTGVLVDNCITNKISLEDFKHENLNSTVIPN